MPDSPIRQNQPAPNAATPNPAAPGQPATPAVGDVKMTDEIIALIAAEFRAGKPVSGIVAKLGEQGVPEAQAMPMIEFVRTDLQKIADQEELTPGALAPGMAAATAAAIVGGIVWAMIVIGTEREIGYVAWGLGWLSGFCVVKFTGGKRGLPLQIAAVASSLLGILIGKYVAFVYYVNQYLEQEGADIRISYASIDSASSFFSDGLPEMVNGFDLLWAFLAFSTAWRMAAAQGIDLRRAR